MLGADDCVLLGLVARPMFSTHSFSSSRAAEPGNLGAQKGDCKGLVGLNIHLQVPGTFGIPARHFTGQPGKLSSLVLCFNRTHPSMSEASIVAVDSTLEVGYLRP